MRAKNTEHDNSLIVSVDSYESKIAAGRVWICNDEHEQSFASLMELLLLLDRLTLQTDTAANASQCKRFVREERTDLDAEATECPQPRRGKRATFRLRILFRRNTSWQGLVTWVEGRQEESFRSALELVMLLDSALCAQEEK